MTTVLGTPITLWAPARSGNSWASITEALTMGEAAAILCASTPAPGQWGQVGVTKTMMFSFPLSPSMNAMVAGESFVPGRPASIMAVSRVLNSYPERGPHEAHPSVFTHRDRQGERYQGEGAVTSRILSVSPASSPEYGPAVSRTVGGWVRGYRNRVLHG
ncbi:MAG: hypothetical protein MZU95_05735 [Desulfomicrobium escambiense]|nr:hypothetical protein [Desulfomicrobium escambiense]